LTHPLAPARSSARPTTGPSSAPVAFADLGVPRRLVAALAADGITSAFPIQQATLPDALRGRDIVGRGRTGSGKTLAFALPLVAALAGDHTARRRAQPRGLVLVPTRELAAQVAVTLVPLADAVGLRVTIVHGGVSAVPQIRALDEGVDIVVACPGRLEDLIAQGRCRLDRVAVTVLDEADHMADLGFLPAVTRLMDQTPRRGQRLLYSATLDHGVDVLVDRYLDDPAVHSVDGAESPVPEMAHHVLCLDTADKAAVVRALASGHERSLLFTRTKHGAKKLALQLTKSGVHSVELHGNLSQSARTRNLALFDSGQARVLVATDIAARGIHVDDVALVVHVDPPAEHKAFLHRSGRTARAGARGTVVTLVTPDQRRDVETLTRKAGIRPTLTTVHPEHPLLGDLAGRARQPAAANGPRGSATRASASATRSAASGSRRKPAATASSAAARNAVR
jgi:superfamily II DNA/RNA helicase